MVTKEQAVEIVLREINKESPDGADCVIVDTVEKPYGWMFFYQPRRYLETGNPLDKLIGGGPIVVDTDGSVHHLGVAPLTSEHPWDDFIAAYDRSRERERGR